MKKETKSKAEKVYLKKGHYTLNDIYYDIFLSSNGKHYFSFVNDQGRTVLLNGNISGFESLDEAEAAIEEVLKFASQKDRFEIKTAKDGKFFFNLYNEKGEKIAKSFFFRKREDIEASLNEFVTGRQSKKIELSTTSMPKNKSVPKTNIISATQNSINENYTNKQVSQSNINEKQKLVKEKSLGDESLLAEKKHKEELKKLQEQKAKKEKERALILAANKEKREQAKLEKERLRKEAALLHAQKDPMKDGDLFDGCFRWLWIILILLFLVLILSYFKGCFGNNDLAPTVNDSARITLDSTSIETNTIIADSVNINNSQEPSIQDNSSLDNNNDNQTTSGVESDIYENSIQEVASCNCRSKAIVFDIPSSEAKSIKNLGANPQFGNTHGLSPSDFMEDLKYRYQNSSWDRKYLNYLYKAMGYSGFQDAESSQFSQEKLNPGIKGILGFGNYGGYAFSQLDLQGKDLEVFRVEAANGCHIHFMKTGGNLFFVCH